MLALEASRSIGDLQGCFTTKMVNGQSYIYFQHSDPGGRKRQTYVGKRGPSLDRVIDRFSADRDAAKADQKEMNRLCALLRTGGAMTTDSASSRVIRALPKAASSEWAGYWWVHMPSRSWEISFG